jgi:hypothetical protein
LAAFDAFGQFDFAFTGEQRDCSHFAQIHANGIVCFVDEVLDQLEVREFFAFITLLVVVELGFFEDFDAGSVEVG